MKRRQLPALPSLLLLTCLAMDPGVAHAQTSLLRVEILHPTPSLAASQETIEVHGSASVFGGRRAFDVFLLMDTSKSLRRTDPLDWRGTGARALVWNLLSMGDVRIGIIDFDSKGRVAVDLTTRRDVLLDAIEMLDRRGTSNLAAGIESGLEALEEQARPDATPAIVLFTDGMSDVEKTRRATRKARERGVAVYPLLVGAEAEGEALLREVADGTRGRFLRVTDPARVPAAFTDLLRTGVRDVHLSVNGEAPIPATVNGSEFKASVPLAVGTNHIVATATSPAGDPARDEITVTLPKPGCAELAVRATRGGREALSLADRAALIVLDASNSMWGRMHGDTKLGVAQRTLIEVLSWLPEETSVGLRAYGHRHEHEVRDCEDSELLVPLASGSRDGVLAAIEGLRPRGQTPLGYALEQAAADLDGFRGERGVVLVTDGIESCGGDPVAAARRLRETGGGPVHVIGFGLPDAAAEDRSALRAIAEASGGRFLTAGSARELRDALERSVGTRFRVLRGDVQVAEGALGSEESILLPAGDYAVLLESDPPRSVPVTVSREERVTLTFVRQEEVDRTLERSPAAYVACEDDASVPPVADLAPDAGEASRAGD